jgi:hypothetical protein
MLYDTIKMEQRTVKNIILNSNCTNAAAVGTDTPALS